MNCSYAFRRAINLWNSTFDFVSILSNFHEFLFKFTLITEKINVHRRSIWAEIFSAQDFTFQCCRFQITGNKIDTQSLFVDFMSFRPFLDEFSTLFGPLTLRNQLLNIIYLCRIVQRAEFNTITRVSCERNVRIGADFYPENIDFSHFLVDLASISSGSTFAPISPKNNPNHR